MKTRLTRGIAAAIAAAALMVPQFATPAQAGIGRIAPSRPMKLDPASQIVARPGQSGTVVGQVQQALVKTAFLSAGVRDAQFGTSTKSAVRKYQRSKGLQDNGNVSRALLESMTYDASHVKGIDSRCYTGARVICVNRAAHRTFYLTNGKLQATFDSRTGGPGHATRLGVYAVYMKDTNWFSTLYHVDMPYSMFFDGGEAVHFSQSFANMAPLYGNGSGGCVNLRDYEGIKWLYSQVRVGDKVVVYN